MFVNRKSKALRREAKCVEKINNLVKDNHIERFFVGKEDFIQMVATNTMKLENDTTTYLGRPLLLPKTVSVSLYKKVIYCGKCLRNGYSKTTATP